VALEDDIVGIVANIIIRVVLIPAIGAQSGSEAQAVCYYEVGAKAKAQSLAMST